MQFYVAAGAGETLPRGRFRPVRAAYRLGPRLLSAIGGAPVKGGLMLVGDSRECGGEEILAQDILRECLKRSYDGVILDWWRHGADHGGLSARIGQLCHQYQRRLFVPEAYAAYAAHSTVLINTAVSGGTLRSCLEEAVRRYGAARIALDLERMRLDFTLPLSANIRRALTAAELRRLREGKTVYFSQELCCRYFTYRSGSENHYVLFDDAQTLRAKAAAGEKQGIREGFFMLPEVADIAGELLEQA